MDAIFLYGSLLDANIRKHVFADTVEEHQFHSAIARNFTRMRYPGEAFPVLVPAQGQCVDGLVLVNANSEALARMAFYEGDEYEVEYLMLEIGNGKTISAHYNQALPIDIPFDEPWCQDRWERDERAPLTEITRLYMERCWGKMTATEADTVWRELQYLREDPAFAGRTSYSPGQ